MAGIGEEDNSIRTACTARGVPTITVEMGEAHRFQQSYVDRALAGIESVLTELGVVDGERVTPDWRRVVDTGAEKTWLRADRGGLVEMHANRRSVLDAGDAVCTVHNHFGTESSDVVVPYRGLVVGLLRNPVAQPGHPVCHFVSLDEETADAIRATDPPTTPDA